MVHRRVQTLTTRSAPHRTVSSQPYAAGNPAREGYLSEIDDSRNARVGILRPGGTFSSSFSYVLSLSLSLHEEAPARDPRIYIYIYIYVPTPLAPTAHPISIKCMKCCGRYSLIRRRGPTSRTTGYFMITRVPGDYEKNFRN